MPEQLTGSYPSRASMWAHQYTVMTGGARTLVVDASQPYNHYAAQTGPANGDTVTKSFYIAAGTYNFSRLGRTTTSLGKADFFFNGVLVVSAEDWYSASLTRNVIKTTTGIVIPTSIRLIMDSENSA